MMASAFTLPADEGLHLPGGRAPWGELRPWRRGRRWSMHSSLYDAAKCRGLRWLRRPNTRQHHELHLALWISCFPKHCVRAWPKSCSKINVNELKNATNERTMMTKMLTILPLKPTARTWASSSFPSMLAMRGHRPGYPAQSSRCMWCRACAMAYTASITNWTFPSCS